VAAVISSAVFGRMPHIEDSVAQLFQARIFAQGRLWAPSHSLRAFFDYTHMINDGRWYSQYPPGQALLLVPGVLTGAAWLTNPILGGLGVLGTYLPARECFDRRIASVAALLGMLSPFLVLMSSEFMSHAAGFCLLTFVLYFFLRARRSGRPGPALAAGGLLALAVLVRPYTAAAFAAPVFLFEIWRLYRERGAGVRPLALAAGGLLVGLLLYALYNLGTTGDPLLPGYIKLYGPGHGLGFGHSGWGPPHTPRRGLLAAWHEVAALNSWLLEWPLTSLWPLALALVLPRPPQARGGIGLLAVIPASLLLAYAFYWYHDLCFGPRYVYEALAPLLILSAVGLVRGGDLWRRYLRPGRPAAAGLASTLLVVGALSAYAALVPVPALFSSPIALEGLAPDDPVRAADYFRHFGRNFWGVSPHLRDLVRERHLERALVFCRFQEPKGPGPAFQHLWFGSAFALEEPDPARAAVIFARDLGEENQRLAALHPDRRTYLYVGTIEQGELREIDLAPRR